MTTPNPPTAIPAKTSIVFAGEEILAGFLEGEPALIRVRAMPARHLGRVMQLCTDEAALLELVCMQRGPADRPGWHPVAEGWADTLTDESHLALLEAAKRLNFTRAAAWTERQIEAKQWQGPLLMKADEALLPLVEKMTRLALSALPAPASPAAPSTTS